MEENHKFTEEMVAISNFFLLKEEFVPIFKWKMVGFRLQWYSDFTGHFLNRHNSFIFKG